MTHDESGLSGREDLAVRETESLPIDEIKRELDRRGVDCRMPPRLMACVNAFRERMARDFPPVLTDDDRREIALIESMPIEIIKEELDRRGVNHRSGVIAARQLVRARTVLFSPSRPPYASASIAVKKRRSVITKVRQQARSPRISLSSSQPPYANAFIVVKKVFGQMGALSLANLAAIIALLVLGVCLWVQPDFFSQLTTCANNEASGKTAMAADMTAPPPGACNRNSSPAP